ncbi:protein transport protein Sec24-like At4g32640 isoform X1 [Ricinus communis]|uniref:protein transport protein Sec24-like At4g32640 isoform X1 n=1 Tax=Ricinus communis TaxID=3988 RepID=UPI00201A3AB4|nr:protein transport protein Sec24-like At4g32640 isoform X1 [Ricinus communis]
MASPMPREPPTRPGYNNNTNNEQTPPPPLPPNYILNANSLAEYVHSLNLNQPTAMPNSGPSCPPFVQLPPFPQTGAAPIASHPMSRPGPPPGALARPAVLPSPSPPSPTLPPNVAPGRPAGPTVVNLPPSTSGSRLPPPGSLSMGGPAIAPPPGSSPSALSTGLTAVPPPGARPSPFASSPPFSVRPAVAPSIHPKSNGPPFASGPRFPPAGNATQPVMGPQLPTGLARGPPQPPSMGSFLGSTAVGVPPALSMQPLSQFTAGSLEFSSPPGPPSGAQSWTIQPQLVAPTPQVPGSVQPPGMFGMAPPLPHQSMTTISPAMGQTGSSLAGPSKIDPSQIPRPIPSSTIIVHETRQGNQANPPPPATSEYMVRDTGNCSPRYMRCTINQIPCTVDLLNTSGMQLALLVQPLALLPPSEEPIQVVDFGESGPVRCSRCKGYINPFMRFIDQGRRFICNLCGFTDETPRDYHCNLGPDGRRRDADERPELCRGAVEFVATKEYMVREPMPAVYFFLIDVSINAIQTGAVAAACIAISRVISDLPEGPRTMVGIATFDSTIHFYNLKRALQQPLMLIVPDIEDVYTPLHSDVIVQLSECRQHLEILLETIPSMFQSNKTSDSAFGAAIKAAFLAMKSTGGKLLVFQSVLPSLGIGSLSSREAEGRTNISSGEKEAHTLLQPADKTFKTMAIELAESQVCVDVFLTTQTYVDITSISVIPRTTGGQVYYYYPFSALSDPAKLYNDLRWNITRSQGFEAVMRVRCSQGIQVQEYSGNFCKRVPTDIDLPGIDCDKTIMITLKHDDKLQDGSECAFQCALLYTTVYGQRRIRVITLSLPCTNMLSNLFRTADLDTQFACLLKQVASRIRSSPVVIVREQVTELCINILLSYRKFCATVSSTGQLILPEALKLLPLYNLALMKSTGLRTDGRIDDRSFWINYVLSLSAPLAIPLVYPRMVAIHDPSSTEDGESLLPTSIALSSEHIKDEGIYLLENGEDALLYVGNLVGSDIVQQIFGISSVDEISVQFVLQQYDNPLSKKLNNIINEMRRQRCSYLRLKLCKKEDPSGGMFNSYMVEDKNASGPSYIEFLVHVHRQIQIKMS